MTEAQRRGSSDRVAVVLFNLGGPDGPEAVEPFLFNLFNDPAIIKLPRLIRPFLARFIAKRRGPTARAIYDLIGGGSPLLPNTIAQADALEAALATVGTVKVFIAMRYWHPLTPETVDAVAAFRPDRIVLLPLYPQFSTTTTGSSVKEWHRVAKAKKLSAPTTTVCCYPRQPDLIKAFATGIAEALDEASKIAAPRLLFSAHGLPERVVAGGDPYRWQVEETAARVLKLLNRPGLDSVVCFQSRVGPLKWIQPSTDAEIRRAAADGKAIVICPIAFVSEHSETLVEIEIEYRHMAGELGAPAFVRVPALGAAPDFVQALAASVRNALAGELAVCSGEGKRLCPADRKGCAMVGVAAPSEQSSPRVVGAEAA